jgi:hypothetical protein
MKIRTLLLGGIVGALLAGGVAVGVTASAAGASTTYYACLSAKGSLSKVGTKLPTCLLGSKIISWNSQGPQGIQGVQGIQGPSGPAGGAQLSQSTWTGTLPANSLYISSQTAIPSGFLFIPISVTVLTSTNACPGNNEQFVVGMSPSNAYPVQFSQNLTGANIDQTTGVQIGDWPQFPVGIKTGGPLSVTHVCYLNGTYAPVHQPVTFSVTFELLSGAVAQSFT